MPIVNMKVEVKVTKTIPVFVPGNESEQDAVDRVWRLVEDESIETRDGELEVINIEEEL